MRERKVGDVGREGTGQQTMQDFGSYFEIGRYWRVEQRREMNYIL